MAMPVNPIISSRNTNHISCFRSNSVLDVITLISLFSRSIQIVSPILIIKIQSKPNPLAQSITLVLFETGTLSYLICPGGQYFRGKLLQGLSEIFAGLCQGPGVQLGPVVGLLAHGRCCRRRRGWG